MDELDLAKIVEMLKEVQVLPDTALVFIGVLAFIALALGFLWVIGILISLQAEQTKINAGIQTSQRDLMVESNRQTELMRIAFDAHNGLERQRNQTLGAYAETIQNLQRTFLEKLPQLLEAEEILEILSRKQDSLALIEENMVRELTESRLELRKLSGQVKLLVNYAKEGKERQVFIDSATANMALSFALLERRVIEALGRSENIQDSNREDNTLLPPPYDLNAGSIDLTGKPS